jgi:hypothetical protein
MPGTRPLGTTCSPSSPAQSGARRRPPGRARGRSAGGPFPPADLAGRTSPRDPRLPPLTDATLSAWPSTPTAPAASTIAAVLDAAGPPYDRLLERAEEVEDEWSYVNDLAEAWRVRFDEVEAARGGEATGPELVAAVDMIGREADAVDDPHRAIDWLSTYPQLVLIALGERP